MKKDAKCILIAKSNIRNMEPEKFLSPMEIQSAPPQGVPSPKQQQWGVIISIAIIVLMIIIGAFYSWGKRIAEENAIIDILPVSE